ncbi:MAG: response regulator [Bacteroidales bacterium]|nr:response regulator [Bacteroidales bacterium]
MFDLNFFLVLLQNVAVLLSLSLFYEYYWLRFEHKKEIQKLLTGLVLSVIITILMFTPFKATPSILFDTRSILLSISGLFFGFVPTLLATITALFIRIQLGGEGMYMGIAVIITSALLGLLWNKFRKNWDKHKYYWLELLSLGFMVHLAMALYTMLLPSGKDIEVLKQILLPLLLVYIPGEMLLGLLLKKQQNNWNNRKAKEQLLETEFLLHQLINNSQLVSIIINNRYQITYCNQYFLRITGLKEEQILHKNIFDSFFNNIDSGSLAKLEQVLKQNMTTTNFTSEIKLPNNQLLYIHWHVMATYNVEHHQNGFLFVGIDFTEQKSLEKKLMETNEELEIQNENYIQLNKKLEIANKKAEEHIKLKNLILLNLSHEVRTPMNAILGFSELLQKDIPKDKQKQFADIIYNSSKQLLQTIDDVVFLSKLENKDIIVKQNVFSPANLLREIELYYHYKNNQHQIQFSINIPPQGDNIKIIDDEHKVRQILFNLTNNAYHYTQKGFIIVGFFIEGNHIIYYVKDTGIGIADEDKNNIFEAFYRGSDAYTFAIRGMGLGLSIVKHLVELLNGSVWFESEKDKGSIFYVKLPLRPFVAQEKDVTTNHINFLKYKSILVVEDEYNNYLYLEALLKDKVHSLDYAPNGKIAIDLCQKKQFDAIIMDIRMPVMNGIETIQWLTKQNYKTKIIALSAYNDYSTIEEAKKVGCHIFLSKPIKEEDLLEQLHQIFS